MARSKVAIGLDDVVRVIGRPAAERLVEQPLIPRSPPNRLEPAVGAVSPNSIGRSPYIGTSACSSSRRIVGFAQVNACGVGDVDQAHAAARMQLAGRADAPRLPVGERFRLLVAGAARLRAVAREAACRKTGAGPARPWRRTWGCPRARLAGESRPGASTRSCLRRRGSRATPSTATGGHATASAPIGLLRRRTSSSRSSMRIGPRAARILRRDDPERSLVGEERFAVDSVGDDDVVDW